MGSEDMNYEFLDKYLEIIHLFQQFSIQRVCCVAGSPESLSPVSTLLPLLGRRGASEMVLSTRRGRHPERKAGNSTPGPGARPQKSPLQSMEM